MATALAGDPLTGQQNAAVVQRSASVVLSSGAGCGKTHVLTQRYLSHLRDDGAEVGQIVAITFTDRAARQMRERIRGVVLDHVRTAATDAEANRWAHHLRDLETAQISTIHAFCRTLLAQHAVEAGLDPRFEVLEDYLARNLESQALTACLQRLLTTDSRTGKDLRELILLYGWKPVVAATQHLIGQWDEARWAEWLTQKPDEIAVGWLVSFRKDLLPHYIHYAVRALPKLARCLWLLRTIPCQQPRMAAKVARVLELTPQLAMADDLAAALKNLKATARVGPDRANAWPSEQIYQVIKKALADFRHELTHRLKFFLETPEDLSLAITTGQRFLRVAEEAARAYRQLKRRKAVVDFQDLLILTRNLLRDQASVRERLQRRYRFLLIDELQDTDPIQMELVEHLCGAELTEGKLFAVGDHKQSIYRFRGANVQLFQALKQRMPHEGRLGLTLNYRSQPAILDFTNALLGPGSVERSASASRLHGDGLEDYEPLQAYHGQVNPDACVEFLWAPREDNEPVTEARKREADWIARRIAAMINNQEKLVVDRSAGPAMLRPVRPGDVVLLFRAMSNVELYEAALRQYGLDYYLVGGRAFFAQQEIYDLLNLLRALENPQDALSLAGTLRSPFCCLSDEALFLLGRHGDGLWAGLHDVALLAELPADQRERTARAQRGLNRWRGLKDRLPIARLLGEVFADTGYDAATQFEFLGDRKLANLWKLLERARTLERSGLFGMADFIQWLGELVRTQPREEQAATQPENADVVRLMTIHQAKGLEFPVVIVPDVCAVGGGAHPPPAHWDGRVGCVVRPPAENPPPFSAFGWRLWETAEEVEDWREDLRTLYVACTRAQDYLVLSAALPSDYSPANAWMLQLAERFDLRQGQCLDSSIPDQRRPKVRVTDHWAPPPLAAVAPTSLAQTNGVQDEMPVLQHLEFTPHPATNDQETPQFDAEDGSDRTAWLAPPKPAKISKRADKFVNRS